MPEGLQQYVLIQNLEDILSRVNFVDKAPVIFEGDNGIKLHNIISQYQFREKVKCGISSCGTPHAKGYVVSLSNGQEIMIGHVCGKNNFGVDFTNKAREFRALRTHAEHFQILKSNFEQLPNLKKEFEEMLLRSGRLSFFDIKKGISKLLGDELNYWMVQQIRREVSANGAIYQEVFKTENEMNMEIYMQAPGKKKRVSETKKVLQAEIESFEIVYQWHEAEKLKNYFDKIHNEIKNPIGIPENSFKKLIKDLRDYKNNFQELRRFCLNGNKLFQKDNLLKLKYLFNKPDELYNLSST